MATSSWRAIGPKCAALMAAARAASATTASKSAKTAASKSHVTPKSNGILKVVPVSTQLSAFLGASESSRTEAVKKVWDYIKANRLQNPDNKKQILCDERLKTIFDDKDTVDFLEVARLLSKHFKKTG